MTERTSPENAVVSVWHNGVNKGPFAGTAFFVSPSMVLTAAHVLGADGLKENAADCFLGSVARKTEVPISEQTVHFHPQYDIALVELRTAVQAQAYATLDYRKSAYEGQKADFFAFNRLSKNFDQQRGHTIGNFDEERGGYLVDHQVLEGFSGGVVALKNKVIGIITERHPSEQQTLFIPLFLVRDWLETLNCEFDAPIFAEYFVRKPSSLEHARETSSLYRNLAELAIFIDRPKDAYEHVTQSLLGRTSRVKACLCLLTDNTEDQPSDFAKSIALKLQVANGAHTAYKLLEIAQRNDFDASNIRLDAWRASKKEEFYRICLREILSSLNSYQPNPHGSDMDNETELEAQVLELLRNRPKPKVLFLSVSQTQKRRGIFGWIKPDRSEKELEERFESIEYFNQRWKRLTESEDVLPLAFLFCVQVDTRMLANAKKCFVLKKVESDDFTNWKAEVQAALQSIPDYRSEIFSFLGDYQIKFEARLKEQKKDFPITYREFKQQTKAFCNRR